MVWALVALLAVVFFTGNTNVSDVAAGLLETITRGSRLTNATYGSDGVVRVDPGQLAAQAGLDLETYALARAIASEEEVSSPATKAAIGWCMVNYARQQGQGQALSEVLLHAVNPAHSGYFGTQKDIDPSSSRNGHSDRYASTANDPYDGDGQIAAGIYSGQIADATGGCIKFDRPADEKNPTQVATNRANEGLTEVAIDGVDAGLRFWRAA